MIKRCIGIALHTRQPRLQQQQQKSQQTEKTNIYIAFLRRKWDIGKLFVRKNGHLLLQPKRWYKNCIDNFIKLEENYKLLPSDQKTKQKCIERLCHGTFINTHTHPVKKKIKQIEHLKVKKQKKKHVICNATRHTNSLLIKLT